jgi:uncharacterized protein (TIGR03435 family)
MKGGAWAAVFGLSLLGISPNNVLPLFAADQAAPQSGNVVFEVASVRLSNTASGWSTWRIEPGGEYRATRVTLENLILSAYGIERYRLVGGPRQLMAAHFDVVAKATGELTTRGAEPTFPEALRALLKDRFKLVEHTEVRQFEVYALKVARDDGRLGPTLSPSTIDCAAIRSATLSGERSVGRGEQNPCAVSAPGTQGRYFGGSVPLTSLIGALRPNVDRPVIDQTGLQGNFKIELNWGSPVMPPSLALLAGEPPGEPLPSRDGPSIFTAVQDQLGLRLEPTVASLSVVVIDAVEYPVND